MDDKVLDTYVGTYELNAENVFTVTREGPRLLVQRSGDEGKEELLAQTPDRFVVKSQTEIVFVFVTGESGWVEHLSIEVEGRKLSAKRRE